ncbi:hypothetical protein PLEOSDRAFT_1080287 [Pleurotus ostreatus PC15]|uniref:F-box domain-containing protein n=1 Tax=Pleurotus ostreatus (strain PC15) TaxID=1137138 RepID=A0A067NY25_PLEO1|nr:hypothetical protein PLEOSDRAFT_1080287 [Pleurotus ostreatus PC15]
MTQKFPPLPTEVWLQIASYIPEREMPKLYPLSRAFYELGMDAIYQELRIRSEVHRSKKPFISRRVLALDIHLDAFDALVASRVQSSLGLFASLFYRPQGPHDVTRMSAPEVSSILLNSVKYMTSLRRCRLRIPSSHHIYTYLPFIRALWEGVRSRVEDLALEVPGNVLNVVLPVSVDSMLQVHALSLVLCDKLDGWGSSYASQLIADFFNQAAPGLESLSLVSSPATPLQVLDGLAFDRLAMSFAALRTLSITANFLSEPNQSDSWEFIPKTTASRKATHFAVRSQGLTGTL